MKCKSCNEEVSQKFSHAITTNACPYCGNEIVPVELQVSLSELKEVMTATDQYHDEIFDWLKFHYGLISRDSEEYKALQEKAELASKMPSKAAIRNIDPKAVQLDHNGNQISGETSQEQVITDGFMQRAQVKTLNQQDRYRDIVNQIKKHGVAPTAQGGMTVEADPEETALMEAELTGGLPSIGSGLMSNDFEDAGEEIPAIVQAMAQSAGAGPHGADYNAKDVAKLQALQAKSKRASSAMASGGSVGLIRR